MGTNGKSRSAVLGALLALAASYNGLMAQSDPHPDTTESAVTPSKNKTEASLFYFLVMSGKTQGQFQPLTQSQRAEAYAKGLFSPFLFATAGVSAGIAQWDDVPHAWGQGVEGYGKRFANYFAKQTITRTLRWGAEAALHEDNRYFQSGKQGLWPRLKYCIASSVIARRDDGRQVFSLSRVGSTAGAAFISRTWQPNSDNSVKDGVASFGISMGANAGINVLREFLPDVLRKFRRGPPSK